MKQIKFRKVETNDTTIGLLIITLSIVLLLCVAAFSGGSVDAKGDFLTGVHFIDDSNRMLIGTRIVASDAIVIKKGQTDYLPEESTRLDQFIKDGIIRELDVPDIFTPSSMTKFTVDDGVTPELIFTNGACAVFSPKERDGWFCAAGERLVFHFEQYSKQYTYDETQGQIVLIGYIKDGVMYDGQKFSTVSGSYEVNIQESGNYQIYLMSAASDYVAFHEGSISLLPV